ncbi:hypothetical protein HDU93_006823, partial [Gonapodya sp. JEL0774]
VDSLGSGKLSLSLTCTNWCETISSDKHRTRDLLSTICHQRTPTPRVLKRLPSVAIMDLQRMALQEDQLPPPVLPSAHHMWIGRHLVIQKSPHQSMSS